MQQTHTYHKYLFILYIYDAFLQVGSCFSVRTLVAIVKSMYDVADIKHEPVCPINQYPESKSRKTFKYIFNIESRYLAVGQHLIVTFPVSIVSLLNSATTTSLFVTLLQLFAHVLSLKNT